MPVLFENEIVRIKDIIYAVVNILKIILKKEKFSLVEVFL